MRDHLGEEYAGTVSAATGFGIFVTLDELYVEGLVHITELGGEYFRFDEARQELRGERSGVRYAVGTRVRVQVSRVDLDSRRIDFRIVREESGEALLTRTRRSGPAEQELADVKVRDRATKAARARAVATKATVGKSRTAQPKSPATASRGRKAR